MVNLCYNEGSRISETAQGVRSTRAASNQRKDGFRMAATTLSPLERFFNKVQKSEDPDGCWLWTAAKDRRGYGRFFPSGERWKAHRFSYAQLVGQIPAGLQVLHNCPGGDNPSCVNPAHLWLGTHDENMADMSRKGRSHAQAHPETLARGERHGRHTHPETIARGEDAPNAILTDEKVREIRRRFAQGGITKRALAAEFGTHETNIGFIVRREHWAHVQD